MTFEIIFKFLDFSMTWNFIFLIQGLFKDSMTCGDPDDYTSVIQQHHTKTYTTLTDTRKSDNLSDYAEFNIVGKIKKLNIQNFDKYLTELGL